MQNLTELKVRYKELVAEINQRFIDQDNLVFSDSSSRFTTRNAYIVKNESDANYLRAKEFELTQIEEKCKKFSGSNKNGLKSPKIFFNARRLRVWVNDATTIANEPYSREILIERVTNLIQKANTLLNSSAKEAKITDLTNQLQFLNDEVESEYLAVFRGNKVVKAHVYLNGKSDVIRFNISESGLFVVPAELSDFDLKTSTNAPEINSIYDRLEPIPCDAGMICQFYRKSEVEKIKIEQNVVDQECMEKALANA